MRPLRRRAPSFAEFAARFLRDHARGLRSDFYDKRIKLLCSAFGPRRLDAITRADLDRYVARRLTQVRTSTVRREIAVLRVLFRRAVEWDVLTSSPVLGLRRVREPPHRTRFLTPEEWRRFLAAAPAWLKPIATLAVLTGMRLKEVVGLRLDDWDRDAHLLHVPTDSKTPQARTIPLSAEAEAVLTSLPRPPTRSGFLFRDGEGEPYATASGRNRITKATIAAMRAAGIERASFHTLRHTAATWMVRAGVPLYEVQRILGHSTPLMTQRYAALAPDDLRRAVDVLGRLLPAPDEEEGR